MALSADEFLADIPSKGTSVLSADDFLADVPDGKEQKKSGKKSFLKSLLPTKEEIPEFVGSMAGGFGKLSPLVSGLGAGTGEAIRQIGERAGAFETPPPETSEEAAKRIAMAFGRGAGGELIGKGAGKLLTPFKGGVSAGVKKLREAAESVGIKAPLSTLSESKFVQSLERGLEFTPFGTMITRQRQKALEGFKDYAENVGKKISVDRPPEITGNFVKEELSGITLKFGETTDKMYDTVIPLIKRLNPEPNLSRTIGKLDEIIERRGGELEPSGLNKLRELRKSLTKKTPEARIVQEEIPALAQKGVIEVSPEKKISIDSFLSLKKARTNLGLKSKWGDPSVSGLEKDLKELYGAMTEDLNETVKKVSVKAYNDLNLANETYKQGQELLKSKLFSAISTVKPENVYKLVIIPRNPSQIDLAKELIPDTFDDVARQWFDAMVKESTNPDGVLSPVKLAKRLDNYGSTINKLTEDNIPLREALNKLKDISVLLSKGRDVTQGSQTAFIAGAGTLTGALIAAAQQAFTNPALSAKILAGIGATGLGVAGFVSKKGRQLLTTGFPMAGKVVERIVQPATQLGLQKLSEE